MRLLSVSVCLCAFTFLMPPQLAMARTESAEKESPGEEDGENSKEELSIGSSEVRFRVGHRRFGLGRLRETGCRLRRSNALVGCSFAIVGHALVNGLRAPLRI